MTQEYDKTYWHTEETRIIPWPGGKTREITLERIYWGSYDAAIQQYGVDPVKVAGICIETALSHRAPIDEAFGPIVGNLEHHLEERRRPLREVEDRFGKNVASRRIGPIVFKDELERIDAHIAALEACKVPIDDDSK